MGLVFGLFAFFIRAEDYSGSNFIILDPLISGEGGRSSSPGFELFDTSYQILTGESTSSSFIQRAGFLYYPIASSPAVSATPGDGQVSLSWTSSTGTWANVTAYDIGTSTVSGGPYSYESVGNVLSFTKTGLTNGISYYFKVRAMAGTSALGWSAEVSATPTGAPPPPIVGIIGYVSPQTGVNFSGMAYPSSKITILKDGQIAVITLAGLDANFYVSLTGLSAGQYIFSVIGEDNKGNRSTPFTFSIFITEGAMTTVSGIFIAPTIAVDKEVVKRGENIAIFGQSVPQSDVIIGVNSEEEAFVRTKADNNGAYLYNFDTSFLELDQHFTRSKAAFAGLISSFGKSIGFKVGTVTIPKVMPTCPLKGDLNGDCRVNLVDFSIAAYWWERPLTKEAKENIDGKLWPDGIIDLRDFSIMAYYWTG